MKKYTIPFLLLFASYSYAETVTKEFDITGLKEVELKNSSGNITIRATENAKAKVTAEKKVFDKNCTLYMEKDRDELQVGVKESSGLFSSGGQCQVNFVIEVPQNIDLELRTGSGNISSTGLNGKIDFKTGSGDLTFSGKIRELEGKTGSGTLRANGLMGDTEVKAGSGNIYLTYESVPQKGEIDLKVGSGNAYIKLPRDSKILTSLKSGSGNKINEIGDTPGAKFQVSMKAGSGNLEISKK